MVLFGAKVPAPPLHVALAAAPPMEPAKVTVGLLAQTVWSAPAFAVATALIVITIVSIAAPQGPAGSSVVSVTVAVPAVISPGVGVYVAFKVVVFGANVPAPLHVALVAAPPNEPARVVAGLLAQTVWAGPAFTVAPGLIVISEIGRAHV